MPVVRGSRRKSIVLAPSRRHLVSEKEAEIVKDDLEVALEKKEEAIDDLSEHSATPTMDSHISEDLPPAHSLSPMVAPEVMLNSEPIVVPSDLTFTGSADQEPVSENVHQEIELEPVAQIIDHMIEKPHRGSSAAEEIVLTHMVVDAILETKAISDHLAAQLAEEVARKENERAKIEAERRNSHKSVNSCRTYQADAKRRAQAKINHQKINQKTMEEKAAGIKRTLRR